MPLIGCFAKPADGDRLVARNALSMLITLSEAVLRGGHGLRGGLSKPIECDRKILADTSTVDIHQRQIILRGGVALVGWALRNQLTAAASLRATPLPSAYRAPTSIWAEVALGWRPSKTT